MVFTFTGSNESGTDEKTRMEYIDRDYVYIENRKE